LELEERAIWEGESTTLRVTVTEPEEGLGRPHLPAVSGLRIEGPSGPMRQEYRIGGRRSVQVSFGYRATPLPGESGAFRIGPARVPLPGGRSLATNAVELKVYKRPPPGVRLRGELSSASGPVGSPFRVVYTLAYTGDPYDSEDDLFSFALRGGTPFGLSRLGLPILKLAGARVRAVPADADKEAHRLSLSDGSQVIIQEGFAEEPDGTAYKALRFGFEVVPLATGRIEIPPASAAMRVKTGRVRVIQDFVFERQVPEIVEHSAESPALEYLVRELPREGRPPGFTGAIGKFRVSASASPTEVDAFAPITLEVRVRGEGLLEELKPPAWDELDALTKDFDISTDIDTGKIEGDAKVFRQVIRARSADVTQIPPVPFPYYDPTLSRYEVALSEAIPIKVRPAKTVSIEPSAPAPRPASETVRSMAPEETLSARSGVRANFTSMGTVRRALDPRELLLEAPFLATLFGVPVAFALFALALRLLERDPRERERAKKLAQARRALSDRDGDLGRIAAAYEEYFRARLDLPPGEITHRELSDALRARGVPEEVRGAAVSVLDELLDARFGGSQKKLGLRERAFSAVREVDRCRFR
ncbi:MAG: hypothetical protein ACUVYA_20985, partial [Planctomycetota bacterium]